MSGGLVNETLDASQKGRLNRQGNTIIPPAAWKVYLFICSEADRGHTCTLREISMAMGWKSPTHFAYQCVRKLRDAGLISMETCKEKVKSRTIRPLYVVRLFREPPA